MSTTAIGASGVLRLQLGRRVVLVGQCLVERVVFITTHVILNTDQLHPQHQWSASERGNNDKLRRWLDLCRWHFAAKPVKWHDDLGRRSATRW